MWFHKSRNKKICEKVKHELQVQIYELRVQIQELQAQI